MVPTTQVDPTPASAQPTSTPSASHPLEPSSTQQPAAPTAAPTAAAAAAAPTEHGEAGITTPPSPMVHVRALIISGDTHVFSFEPEMTVGRMKELIWSMWPSEWTSPAQPPSPSFLRILYAGRVLSDESTLSSNNLPASVTPTLPTVIHISVRSFSMRAEEADPKKPSLLHPVRSRHTNAAEEDVGGCKCVIM